MKPKERIAKALKIAEYGSNDEAHHEQWVIDQMVRVLLDCPVVTETAIDVNNETYTFETLGENDQYRQWVEEYESGKDGPHTYSWDVGIAS